MKRSRIHRYLSLETSSPQLSLALGDGEKVLAAWSGKQHWRHAESLLSGIDKILKKKRWTLNSLTGIAISVGPGSFTGIRIGLAAARALGQFLKIPVVGISSLETLAYASQGELIAPVMDALRDHVFAGLYRRSEARWSRLEPDIRCSKNQWQRQCAVWKKTYGDLVIVPAGVDGKFPTARSLLDVARPRLKRAPIDSYKRVLPLYLRDATATERLKSEKL